MGQTEENIGKYMFASKVKYFRDLTDKDTITSTQNTLFSKCEFWVTNSKEYLDWKDAHVITPEIHEALYVVHQGDRNCKGYYGANGGTSRYSLKHPICKKCMKGNKAKATKPMPHRFNRALSIVLEQAPDIVEFTELDHYDAFNKVLTNIPNARKVYAGEFFPKQGKTVAHG